MISAHGAEPVAPYVPVCPDTWLGRIPTSHGTNTSILTPRRV